MTKQEFNNKQNEKLIELLKQPKPTDELEKDIYNLKLVRYSITMGSKWYNLGAIKTLDRTIQVMESLNTLADIPDKEFEEMLRNC